MNRSIVDDDCEDQALSATDHCTKFECQTWSRYTQEPVYPKLVKRGQFWCCPKCGGSYGTNPHPDLK